jgi:predicted ester cyclase
MSKNANLQTQSMIGEIVASRDWDRLGEAFSSDYVDHDPAAGQPAGPAGIAWYWKRFATAFPDFKVAPDALAADEDYVTFVYRLSGTQQGEWDGIAPTGRSFDVRAMQTSKFVDGKVVERWGSTDTLGMHQQLAGSK